MPSTLSCCERYWEETLFDKDGVISESEGEFIQAVVLGNSGNHPWGIAVSPSGNVWVAEWSRVTVLDHEGGVLFRIGSFGSEPGQFQRSMDVEIANGYAWITDAVNDRVQVFDEEGDYVTQFGEEGSGAGQFDSDYWFRLAVAGDGDIWVTDAGNQRVERWEAGWRSEWQLSQRPATAYSYDQAGNLTAVERSAAGGTGAIDETYAYDATGLRASQTVSSTTSHLTWNTSAELPLLLDDDQRSYIYGPGGLPIGHISEGTPTYYHHDQLGSTRMLTGASGNPTATFTYDPYGTPAGTTGTETTPLGYAGQYTNQQSGLQYLRARVYDPVTGQFLTRDPVEALTREPYAYARTNPLNFVDPTGECVFGLPCPEIEIDVDLCDPALQVGLKSPLCMNSQERENTAGGIIDQGLSPPFSGVGPIPKWSGGPFVRDLFGLNGVEECSPEYQGAAGATAAARLLGGLPKVLQYAGKAKKTGEQLSRRLNEKFTHVNPDW